MIVTIALDEQACILQLHPNSSQYGYEHLQHADILLSFLFVLIHCTALSKWYFLFFVIYPSVHIQLSS